MNHEIFHLYGIKFFVSGDIKKARAMVSQARKMQFQLGLSNVPQLHLHHPDGSFVRVLRQAGMDFAQIYVPQNETEQRISISQREVNYYPAFEAFVKSKHVGYIIARGGGFNGPWEFIPKTEEDLSYPWWYGSYVEDGADKPFDTLDEYLEPKFVYQDFLIEGNKKTDRVFHDITPIGVQNRFYRVLTDYDEVVSSDTLTENSEFLCCFEGATFISGDPIGVVGSLWTAKRTGTKTYDYCFCIGAEGKDPDFTPDDYNPIGTTISVDAGQIVQTETADGKHRTYYQGAWAEVEDHTCAAVEAYLASIWDSEEPDLDSFADIGYGGYSGRYDSTTNTEVVYTYASSAVDENQHCFIYGLRKYVDTEYVQKVLAGDPPWPCSEEYLWFVQTLGYTQTSDSSYNDNFPRTNYIRCSNDTIDLSADISLISDVNPRYYQVNNKEFFLSHIRHDYSASSNLYKHTYFCAIKVNGQLNVFDNFTLSGQARQVEFPDFFDPEGNQLILDKSFRLIREEKIIKTEREGE